MIIIADFVDSIFYKTAGYSKIILSVDVNIYGMEIIYAESDSELRITPVGELDEHAARDARSSIDNILERGKYSRIVLDMSRLSFMDSTGIGVLVGRYKKYGRNSAFFIASPTKVVDKILKLSGIYTIMPRII